MRLLDSFFGPACDHNLTAVEKAEGKALLADFVAAHAAIDTVHAGEMLTSLKTTARAAVLDADHKDVVRQKIASYQRHLPVSPSVAGEDDFLFMGRLSPMFSVFSLWKPVLTGVMIAVLGGGAAVSYASQAALPGDSLYPFKIYVSEHPYLHLYFAQRAQAAWSAELAERRLEEAEQLAADGKLTDQAHVVLTVQFQRHAKRARDEAAFDTVLDGHEAILRTLVTERGEADVQLRVLIDRVQAAKRELMPSSAPAAGAAIVVTSSSLSHVDARALALRQIEAAHRRIEQVRIYLQAERRDVRAETMGLAQEKLNTAAHTLAKAQATLDAGMGEEAANLAKKASLVAQEAKLYVRAEAELKIDLRTPLPKGTLRNEE